MQNSSYHSFFMFGISVANLCGDVSYSCTGHDAQLTTVCVSLEVWPTILFQPF